MHARIALIGIVAAGILCTTAPTVSADASALPPGVLIVPPAWEGIWDVYEETTSDCAGGSVTTRSYRDTLCAGDTIEVFTYPPYSAHPTYCSGAGFTDTALALDCNFFIDCHACCPYGNWAYNKTWDADWSLSGDVATTTVTVNSQTTATAPCESSSTCTRTTGTRTRVTNETSPCDMVVPVQKQTWGSLKLRYR